MTGRLSDVRSESTAEEFSLSATIGGVHGLVESIAPGLVFVVWFVTSGNLPLTLALAVATCAVAVIVRLAQRGSLTQALSGVLGIGVGVIWAWRSGDAGDFYLWGLLINAAYLVAWVVSILVRWPLVGLMVESLKMGFSGQFRAVHNAIDTDSKTEHDSPLTTLFAWRRDPRLVNRYALASWFWVGMFALRLAVKLPLYLSDSVGWLGTAHLVLGVPLWALVLWLTWAVVSPYRARGTSSMPTT